MVYCFKLRLVLCISEQTAFSGHVQARVKTVQCMYIVPVPHARGAKRMAYRQRSVATQTCQETTDSDFRFLFRLACL